MKKYKKHTMPDGTWYLTNLDGTFADLENGHILHQEEIEELETPDQHIINHHNSFIK